uniref:Uncharacterized protein n=1 Tax=Pyramimonas orientalis virus TaxID=455367 RepID=A0A7M3UP55_POV01|nr:hypothetical protein HWQ62_00383 [Pyramimonas orientalis virus]
MYIAFMITHKNFNEINENYFYSIKRALIRCLEDKNYVHVFFNTEKDVHRFDKHFTMGRFKLFHKQIDNYTNDIEVANNCYHDQIVQTGFDYHWIVKINPTLIIFDQNIFDNLRTKYSFKHIHSRSRMYVGPLSLKKHQKSNWESYSHRQYPKTQLSILDDQLYMIPYPLQYYAFTSSKMGIPEHPKPNKAILDDLRYVSQQSLDKINIHKISDTPEKNQTIIWNRFNIPYKITEFYVVSVNNMAMYNLATVK